MRTTQERRALVGGLVIVAAILFSPGAPGAAASRHDRHHDDAIVLSDSRGRDSIRIDHPGTYLLVGPPERQPDDPPPSLAISAEFACHADWSLSQLAPVFAGNRRDVMFALVRVHRVHHSVVAGYRFDWSGPYIHGFDGQYLPPRSGEERADATRARPANCEDEDPGTAIPQAPALSRAEALEITQRLSLFARRVDRLEGKLVPWSELARADDSFSVFGDEAGSAWVVVLAGKFSPEYPDGPVPKWKVHVFNADPPGLRFITGRTDTAWPDWFEDLHDRAD